HTVSTIALNCIIIRDHMLYTISLYLCWCTYSHRYISLYIFSCTRHVRYFKISSWLLCKDPKKRLIVYLSMLYKILQKLFDFGDNRYLWPSISQSQKYDFLSNYEPCEHQLV